MEAVKLAFSKLFVFQGRSRRSEYWWFYLFASLCSFVLLAISKAIVSDPTLNALLTFVFQIGVIVIGLGLAVRRLHDVGKSGWWLFISLLPFIGAIWLIVLLVTDSQMTANQYGESPKYVQE